jgi:hypothetical protein
MIEIFATAVLVGILAGVLGHQSGYSRGLKIGLSRKRPGEGRLHNQDPYYVTVKKPREHAFVLTYPKLLECNYMNAEKAAEVWDEVTTKGKTVEVNGITFSPDFMMDLW